MKDNVDAYTYRVTWSEEDQQHVGLCAEFPSLSWLATDMMGAIVGIRDLVASVVTDMQENDEELPEPLSLRKYSGKFNVRVTPDVHRALAIQAAEFGVSLNALALSKLSS